MGREISYPSEYDFGTRYHSVMNRTSSSTSSIVSTSTSLITPTVSQTLMSTQSTVPTSMASAMMSTTQGTVSASISTRNVSMSTSRPEIRLISTWSTRYVSMSPSRNSIRIMLTSTSSTRNGQVQLTGFTTNAASRRSVEMLPSVVIMEKGVCSICLEEWCKGDLATELPCKHKYHLECVEKWLRIHATCPQCRYVMPLKDENVLKNVESSVDDDEDSSSDSDSSDSDSEE